MSSKLLKYFLTLAVGRTPKWNLLLQSKYSNWEDMVGNFRVSGNSDTANNEMRAFTEVKTERKIISK